METGVYEILNSETGVWYRGATGKQTFKRRWGGHKSKLNRGQHYNEQLQQDWDEYGVDAFVFSVLEPCPPEQCDEREQWWIGDDYNDPDISYNKQSGGTSGFTFRDETKRKRSEDQKRRWADPETRRKMSNSLKIAMNRPEVKHKIAEAHKCPESILKRRLTLGKQFTCTWPNGRVKEYLSTTEAANKLGVGPSTIRSYLKGTSTPGNRPASAHLKGCVFAYVK